MNQERYSEAVQAYEEAIRLDPNSTVSWYNKGNALKSLDRYDEAIQAYDQAIRLDPNFAEAWRKKAAALSASGRYDEAVLAFNEAMNISNEREDAGHKGLGGEMASTTLRAGDGEGDSASNEISISFKGPDFDMVGDLDGESSEGAV